MYDFIIIGAGVSGITAAIDLTRRNYKVLVLEKDSKPLRKLLVTGNGHCNLANENNDSSKYHSSSNLYKGIINDYTLKLYHDFLSSLGIFCRSKNGYLYPYSNTSYAVYNSLLKECNVLGIKIILNIKVDKIEKDKLFTINGFKSKNIIIATGSKAWYKESNTSDLLDELNIDYIPFKPSLCRVKTNMNFKEINGLRTDVKLAFYGDDKLIKKEEGKILFKDNYLSGICTYNLSNLYYKYNKSSLAINFIPLFNEETLLSYLNHEVKILKDRKLSELLDSLLNYKITLYILKQNNIKDELWNKYSKDEKCHIINLLLNYKVDIIGTDDFKNSQTVSGGVKLTSINTNTMELKSKKHVYVIGEALDIDGDCGGYNLTIAFMEGLLVGDPND